MSLATTGYDTSTVARPVRVSSVVLFVLVAGGYALGSQLAFSWFGADGTSSSFFPAAGVTLAALVLVRLAQWPVVLLAAGSAEFLVDLSHDLGAAASAGYVVANLTQPLVGAALLLAAVGRADLGRTRDLMAFLALAVVLAPAVGGALGATTFVLLDDGEGWGEFAAEWWVGDGLGVLVVGGAILSLSSTVARPLTRAPLVEGLVLTVAAVLAASAVLRLEWFALVYVPLALLVVTAFRVGTRGVALMGAAIAFVIAQATAEGHTFWNSLDVAPTTALVYLQLGIGIVVASALALAAEITERERMAGELARTETERAVALDRARALEGERNARQRAELLERHAAQLAAAASREAVASVTVGGLETIGVSSAWVQAVEDGELVVLASSGVPAENLNRYGRYPLGVETPPAEAARRAALVEVRTGAELDRRFPRASAGRERLRYESLVSAPLRAADGRVLGVLSLTAAQKYWLDGTRRQLVIGLAEQCGLALERAQLQVEADRAAADAALLARLGEELERATTTAERADVLCEALADDLGAFSVVHVVDDPGGVRIAARRDPGQRAAFDDATLATQAQRALVSSNVVIESVHGLRVFTAALRARGRALGTLTLANDAGAGRMTTVLVQRIATRAALALDNALLYEQERDVSHSLQLGLLGGRPEGMRGTEIATVYLPATAGLEVGGDWYDVFDLPSGHRAFVVGDVVGHGLEAAVAMGQLRGAVRALAPVGTPADLLANLDLFVESVPEAAMATLAYAELDPATGRLRYACAGHPPPVLVSSSAEPRLLWEGRTAPLGSTIGGTREHAQDALGSDEILLLYTDGLVERRDVGLDEMLETLLAAATRAGSSCDALVEELQASLVTHVLEDDVCMLATRRVDVTRFSRAFPADADEIGRLRHALDEWLWHVGIATPKRRELVLAVSEAAVNAAEHAYGFDHVGTVRVSVESGPDGIRASVADDGTWREPAAESDRGRGTTIIRALMDDVSIETDGNGTVVRMRATTAPPVRR